MEITVLPREIIKEFLNDPEERKTLLRDYAIISINTPATNCTVPTGNPEKPFKKLKYKVEEVLFTEQEIKDNKILVLYFHDITIPSPPLILPTKEHADAIFNFVKEFNYEQKIIVHCSAGKSRSGAVGDVLNEYFNKYKSLDVNDNSTAFWAKHQGRIDPNPELRRLLMTSFGFNPISLPM